MTTQRNAPDQQQVIADALAGHKAIKAGVRGQWVACLCGGIEVLGAHHHRAHVAEAITTALAASNAGTDPADGQAVAVDGSGRPSNDRDGACICDYNPDTTDGPQEDCPFHGRPYAYWVERGDRLQAELEAARRGQDTERALDELPATVLHAALTRALARERAAAGGTP